ncbi:hypothetical protein [Cellulomonas sp. ATA003]|uniref:hypothetical protein n=1 Tax=Cellulomonas sp. ATA003 TaxID=3073064 RepID=UPI002873889F|nr:hypothetical protein [Cellulomonas sp. ATA003]WNB85757.1 hypothetical protein REH70_20065 [Cellulomonas sp. ATA003]
MTEHLGPASAEMTPYEREQWARLHEYWAARANERGAPAWLTDGARAVGEVTGKAGRAVGEAGRAVGNVIPHQVKDAAQSTGSAILDRALHPTVDGALHLLGS